MKELSPAEKLRAMVEANKKMIGKKVFCISENSYGIVSEIIDEETFLINFRGVPKRIDIFDVRGTE